MQRRRFLRLVGAAGAAVLAGCSRTGTAADDVQMSLTVRPQTPTMSEALLGIDLRTTGNQPIQGAQVAFEATMTHAGMAPVISAARETEPGRYEATTTFTMVGEWVLIVRATLPDGRTLERTLPLGNVQ